METGLKRIARLAVRKERENFEFREYLKWNCDIEYEEIDRMVIELAAHYSVKIDCTECAGCCKKISPVYKENDIKRLSGRLGISEEEFNEKYLEESEDDLVMREAPCPFLEDNKCSVYDDRPDDCRGFPFLDREEIMFRFIGFIGRTEICPIAFNVMEDLKKQTGFSNKPN